MKKRAILTAFLVGANLVTAGCVVGGLMITLVTPSPSATLSSAIQSTKPPALASPTMLPTATSTVPPTATAIVIPASSATPTATPVPPLPTAIFGRWQNESAGINNLRQINIQHNSDGTFTVQTWVHCLPDDCYWNLIPGATYMVPAWSAKTITILWDINHVESTLLLAIQPADKLKVTENVRYTDGSGRSDEEHTYIFTRLLH